MNQQLADIERPFVAEDFKNVSDRQRHDKPKAEKPTAVGVEDINSFALFSSELLQKP